MTISKFIYPRTIAVTRPSAPQGVGDVGYSSVTDLPEAEVVSNIPASVQMKTTSSRSGGNQLPGAPPGPIIWRILIPLGLVPMGVIKNRDIVTDDLGDRYQVEGAYWNSLGWNLAALRIEAR